MRFNVITLFPDMVQAALKAGVVGQAIQRGDIEICVVNPRTFTADLHHTVDDRPFGGGDGMILLYSPLRQALQTLAEGAGHRVFLSAHGAKWDDKKAREWAGRQRNITLVCGRYGGVDQRFINECIDEEISIGDYILSGGELGALVLIDSVVRLLPNVLGNTASCENESFADGLLEAPLFTRPRVLGDQLAVPRVFLNGDHAKIKVARRLLSLLVTLEKRPDLINEAHRFELKAVARHINEFSIEELAMCGLDPKRARESCGFS